jgi:manganese/zinc/iron transport system permease protein
MLYWLQNIDWSDANFRWVMSGSVLLGMASAVLGCFAFLRGRSLMGDALAHAALPGVCFAFLLTGTKNMGAFLLGAGLAGLAAAWCIGAITRHSRVKDDASQAIVLSVFFGAGIVLLTLIQRTPGGHESGLDKFLFGQAASLVGSEVRTIAIISAVLCLMSVLLFKELKVLCFDADFGRGLGWRMNLLDSILMAMIVAAVVIGLQSVGVVLMAAMLITPPAAARFWTEKLGMMVWLAALFGGISGALGTILSTIAPRMPTGPLIVLAATAVFIFSLLCAPRRGILARFWRIVSTQRQVRRENLIRDLYELTEAAMLKGHNSEEIVELRPDFKGIALSEIEEKRPVGDAALRSALGELQKKGIVRTSSDGRWVLTRDGLRQAHELVRRHRLWETFLMYETSLGLKSAHRDADAVEHFLPPEAMGQLERLLREQGREPRLKLG